MTAQRRGHLLRAAVVGALVSGAVLLPAAPALADVSAQPGALTMKPGEEKTINVTVSDLGPGQNPQANVTVNGLGNDVTLRGPGGCQAANNGGLRCNQNAFDEDGEQFKLAITVSHKAQTSVQQGQSKDGSINIDAGGGNGDDSVNVTLQGPAQAASVTEVSGKVTDQSTGDGVPGAQVTLKDSAGKTHDAATNSQGNYSIKPSNNNPIAPGQVTVTATKEGFTDATASQNAQAGKSLTLAIRMKPTAASAAPSAPVASETGPTQDASAPADQANPQNAANEEDGPSMLSWILIGMGVLLVLLGIGAIVLLVMRRKDDTEGDDADPYGPNPHLAPAGAYGADRTMVGGRSNANDQTAIVGPQQLDEFPDPYAAPAPAPTRVGGAYGGGYDDGQATNVAPGYGDGYGNGGGYRDDRGYGAQQGGYAEEPRGGYGGGGGGYADQPTGVYQGNGANGSEYGAGGYGGGANGYGGGANGYGGAGGGANGYGGGYGANASGGAANVNGGGVNGYGPGAGDGYEGDYGRRGGGDYEGDYGRRGGNDYHR